MDKTRGVQLAAVILTRDESHNIEPCIMTLRDWVDVVVVWDSGSADDTVARARRAGAVVVARPFDNYAAQRQAVLDTIEADWILFVDADERATPAFAAVIKALLDSSPTDAGYWTPRRNFLIGREVRGCGYWPDYQLRLLRRGYARYVSEREVHEIVELDGKEGFLPEPLLHLNYLTWEQFHRKQRAYALFEARILAKRGIAPRPHNYILQPLREFRRRFWALGGWRDGWMGLQLSGWFAWYYGFEPYRILEAARTTVNQGGTTGSVK